MAKKKKKTDHLLYDDYEELSELKGVVSKNNYDFLRLISQQTLALMKDEWIDNIKHNKRFWDKHTPLKQSLGLCRNKAIIGIGAGKSFNKNKDVLKWFVNRDGIRNWEDRDLVTIAANHQYKPLLEMGVIPDFVLLVDASDVVMDQLTKDIPDIGQNTILITGVHCSPRVLEKWTEQGRKILFYSTPSKELKKPFKKYIKEDPNYHQMELGGNVLNGAMMIGGTIFHSSVFMGVGNDLSFEIKDTIEEQRKDYYADGDYSTNIEGTGTGRDEANTHRKWGGFSIKKSNLLNAKGRFMYDFELDLVGTTQTLWVYKVWLEQTLMSQTKINASYHYYNCSEGGILGVMAKEDTDEALKCKDNWYMFDEVCRNKKTGVQIYHTAMLKDALEFFISVKDLMKCHDYDVQAVVGTDRLKTMGIVPHVVLH